MVGVRVLTAAVREKKIQGQGRFHQVLSFGIFKSGRAMCLGHL